MRSGLESTAQSFKVGEVLEAAAQGSTSAGRLARASTSDSTVTSTSIVGVAAEAASSVEGTKLIFYEANPNQEFWGRTRGGLTESSCLYQQYGLFRDSTKNVFLVDLGNAVSTSARVIVTELLDSTGSSGGAVAFRFGTYNSTLVILNGYPK